MIEDIWSSIFATKYIEGSGGGKGGGVDPPTEDPNTLQSRAVARIIDIICEGEIEGFNTATKEFSIFFDETPLADPATGTWNFKGVDVEFRSGLPDQDHIAGFPSVETEIGVITELVADVPITKAVSDTNVDDVRVTVSTPRLSRIDDAGNIHGTKVEIDIHVSPSGGGFTLIKRIVINGKCTSKYQRSYLIRNLSQYGAGPWTIKVQRFTEDSGSAKLVNKTFWDSYTTIINEKMIYPHTALVGITVDSEQFGSRIPSRAYDIKGTKIKVPTNYTVFTRQYSGDWDGTFKTEWCDNPAWVYYDLASDDRYGMNLDVDKIDKWTLYTIAQYCDTLIDDGYGNTEPRFTCNIAITVRKDAIHVLNTLASVFRGMPLWSSGMATVIQDRPRDVTKLVTNANVIDGEFHYEGSSLKNRHTVAKVTWNDINDFCRKQIEYVDDTEGIKRYGYNPTDVVAIGCTSRGQAYRVGKWILESDLHELEALKYRAGFDHANLIPGEIIEVSDSDYTGGVEHRYSGRIVGSTINTLTIDNAITITGGKTYKLAVTLPDGSLDVDIEITNAPGEVTILTLNYNFPTQPQKHAVWMITVSDCAPRKFRVLTNTESEPNIFTISALYYDANKFARIDEGFYFDEISESDIPIGAILPPTNLSAEEFLYKEGGASLYGVLLSWTHPDEPRKIRYDIQLRTEEDGIYKNVGSTTDNSFAIRPILTGTYDFRVRVVAVGAFSSWVALTEFEVIADNTLCDAVTNLQVVGGGTTFSGRDCEIEWDDSTCHVFKMYKVVISKLDDTLLRTDYTSFSSYKYTYQMNLEDTNNSPVREIKFKVYVLNVYDKTGVSTAQWTTDEETQWVVSESSFIENVASDVAILIVENPVPNMAGLTPTLTQRYSGITIDWSAITPAENDMLKYKVYGNDSTPPTTEIYECDAETTYFHWFGLDVGTTYYLQIEPYDMFGVGIKSDIVSEEPVLIPEINIDIELQTNIEMSDSDSNTAATLAKLYDRNKTSDGVAYTLSGVDKYIQYGYAVEDIFDRVIVYTADANAHVYVAYSSDGSNWSYLKAEADHTLTAEGELIAASNQADAQTNYWQVESGTNIAIFPAMIAGRYMRFYMTGTYSTTIYEMVFFREIVAEMAAIDTLAALTANLGTITAGIIQSSNLDATHGFLIDLDNDTLKIGGTAAPDFYWNGTTLVIGSGTSIDGAGIQTGTVTATQIAADTITANEIAGNTITANEIAANAVDTSELNAGAVTATKITAETITANEIYANAYLGGKRLNHYSYGSLTVPSNSSSSWITHNLGRYVVIAFWPTSSIVGFGNIFLGTSITTNAFRFYNQSSPGINVTYAYM